MPLSQIPRVDFSGFRSCSANDRRNVANEVANAFKHYGFVVLENHGVGEQMITDTFEESRKFFRLSVKQKMKYVYATPESNRGYLAYGRERLVSDQPDLKETLEIGKEDENDFANPWPQEIPTFKKKTLEYFYAMDQLHLDVLRCVEIALNLERNMIVGRCMDNHQNLRLLHYPQSKLKFSNQRSLDEQSRIGVHTDYGTLTLLVQNGIGGLQAKTRDGNWVEVPPVKGSVVINVGDMLQRWTNDVLFAAPHRVAAVPPNLSLEKESNTNDGVKEVTIPERFSIAFFCNPNKDVTIDALPNTYGPNRPKKYMAFNSFDYLVSRLRSSL